MTLIISLLVFTLAFLLFLPEDIFVLRTHFREIATTMYGPVFQAKSKNGLYTRLIKPILLRIVHLIPIDRNSKRNKQIKKNLITANKYPKTTLEDFLAFKLGVALATGLYFVFMQFAFHQKNWWIAIVMPVLGYFVPDQMLSGKVRRRRDSIERELPSFLNTLTIITEAGLNLMAALEEVSRYGKGVLAEEMRYCLDEIKIGVPQSEALEKMALKCGVADLSFFVSAVIQGLEKGSAGITQILKEQAKEVWEKRKQKAESLGQKASLKLFLPLVFLVLPAITIFILGPAIMATVNFFSGLKH